MRDRLFAFFMHPISEIVNRNKAGRPVGIYSCCSSNAEVVKAALLKAKKTNTICLIESTSNQVNPDGGYTGMTCSDFAEFVKKLAQNVGLPQNRLILGGDHLGPLPWATENEDMAMKKAEDLVRSCVLAGYTKIHLDTSMRVGDDDKHSALSVSTCARRGAKLCKVAEDAFKEYQKIHKDAEPPVYVVGSEVPIPGGDFDDVKIGITTPEDAVDGIEEYKNAFNNLGIGEVFDRIIGYVCEMGVEFHERHLDEYDSDAAKTLVDSMKKTKISIEGHSTDYQTPKNLEKMVVDGVAILKVGPALTFAMREGMFALEGIECRVYSNEPSRQSRFRDVLEHAMVVNDKAWRDYYTGSENDKAISRAYSYYDRCRYYMCVPEVVEAKEKLLDNLANGEIPLCMLSQYLPRQYSRVRAGLLENNAEEILLDRIGDVIDGYLVATRNNGEM